jgi:hypothetical protein
VVDVSDDDEAQLAAGKGGRGLGIIGSRHHM